MSFIVSRALRARPEVLGTLWQRGMFSPEEKAEISSGSALPLGSFCLPRGSIRFATLLAEGDSQLAVRAVLRDMMLNGEELRWLDRLLRLQKRTGKRDELIRAVERALEGRKGNVRQPR